MITLDQETIYRMENWLRKIDNNKKKQGLLLTDHKALSVYLSVRKFWAESKLAILGDRR